MRIVDEVWRMRSLPWVGSVVLMVAGMPMLPAGGEEVRPLVIAHRGASGYRPEHTLAAYELAIAQGADYIEPDLVFTKDGVLVARHENEIGGTTDVASHPRFADRRRTQVIDGERITGWFTEDFTLEELRTLRARERLPGLRPGSAAYDGRYAIPTLGEILVLLDQVEATEGRRIGLIPETKHPGHFAALGHDFSKPLLKVLAAHGRSGPDARVWIQSFEAGNLEALHLLTALPLMQLVGEQKVPPERLTAIARYAKAIGPPKALVLGHPDFVRDAHAAGLEVHVWTFRAENHFLTPTFRRGLSPAAHGDLAGELREFQALGVDAVFTDFPDIAVQAFSPAGRTPLAE